MTDASRDVSRERCRLLREYGARRDRSRLGVPGPGCRGNQVRPEDKQNFTLLLKTLREQLDAASERTAAAADRYLLTIASADREYFEHTEMNRLHVYLDWINVMSYDFFNSLTPTTGHHAGLYASEFAAPTDRNADASIRQHLAAGIPPHKLVLGVAFYGRGFADVEAAHDGLNQPLRAVRRAHPYAELWRSGSDARASSATGTNARRRHSSGTSRQGFVTYDDPQSIREEGGLRAEQRLGGMMFWELSQDRNEELLDVIVKGLE